MYLSSYEITRSREHALNNLLDLSAACIDAGRRLSDLMSANSREALRQGSGHLVRVCDGQPDVLALVPATMWLESAARASHFLDSTLEVIGETQKAMIRNAESQVRMLDEIVFATINRATRTSPWEAEFALRTMKASLQGAEQTLHGISEAAIETVTLAESEIHHATEVIAASAPAARRRSPSARKAVST